MRTMSRKIGLATAVLALLVIAFISGAEFQSAYGSLNPFARIGERLAQMDGTVPGGASLEVSGPKLGPVQTFWEVLQQVRRRYYKPLSDQDERQMAYGAASGMLRSLKDPYSRFLAPEDYRQFNEQTEGHFDGIGAELESIVDPQTNEKKVIVQRPLPNGPAVEAGLQPGDWIVGVDDANVAHEDIDKVVSLIRGPRGTPVRLVVMRKGHDDPIELTIMRAKVEPTVVEERMLGDGIGYLRLHSFNEPSLDRMKAALSELHSQGMKALIFDLRDNTGGLLEAAVNVVSLFSPEGPAVYIEERDNPLRPYPVDKSLYLGYQIPMVVLVNGQSASASEIVAGALKDKQLAQLVGTRTFGKGLVQTVLPIEDSAAVILTTAQYLTPAKRVINGKGVQPDYEVSLSEDQYNAWLRHRLSDSDDPQLQKAVGVLKEAMAQG